MTIRSRPSSAAYAAGWERVFGKKRRRPKTVKAAALRALARKYKVPGVSRETRSQGGAIGAGDFNDAITTIWNHPFQHTSSVWLDAAVPTTQQGL